MEDTNFSELAGRVEGLARAYLLLVAALQQQGLIDEQLLQADLRTLGGKLPASLAVATRTLTELADGVLRHHMLKVRGLTQQDVDAVLALGRA